MRLEPTQKKEVVRRAVDTELTDARMRINTMQEMENVSCGSSSLPLPALFLKPSALLLPSAWARVSSRSFTARPSPAFVDSRAACALCACSSWSFTLWESEAASAGQFFRLAAISQMMLRLVTHLTREDIIHRGVWQGAGAIRKKDVQRWWGVFRLFCFRCRGFKTTVSLRGGEIHTHAKGATTALLEQIASFFRKRRRWFVRQAHAPGSSGRAIVALWSVEVVAGAGTGGEDARCSEVASASNKGIGRG